MKILLVDDQPLFRSGTSTALAGLAGLARIDEVGGGDEAIRLVGHVEVDLAILEIEQTGVALISRLREMRPACHVLVVSTNTQSIVIAEALRAGARGYAFKTQSAGELVEAVEAIRRNDTYLAPSIDRAAIDSVPTNPFDRLSPREHEVFLLVIQGHSCEQIARTLFIARRTVETHRQRILAKLGAHSAIELIQIASTHRALLSPSSPCARARHDYKSADDGASLD